MFHGCYKSVVWYFFSRCRFDCRTKYPCTVDGSEILHQLIDSLFVPLFTWLQMPGDAGFLPSTVWAIGIQGLCWKDVRGMSNEKSQDEGYKNQPLIARHCTGLYYLLSYESLLQICGNPWKNPLPLQIWCFFTCNLLEEPTFTRGFPKFCLCLVPVQALRESQTPPGNDLFSRWFQVTFLGRWNFVTSNRLGLPNGHGLNQLANARKKHILYIIYICIL